ncbi:acetylornithine deacetylase [Halogranum amylolyticum]|uniref:Acetylornithine deacetylase n=1 Tax=Halogranum amylolyticum TaxID=660520 RepID=A0A1H8TSJ9_9EURY|nr:M20/M25/M40 family metallo-hydrolase [Halogranum amylolyticum]SEO93841.1 acetylornithine deacetylase [Halogranum amylolyticum]
MTDLRTFAEALLRFDTTGGDEAAAQAWFRERLYDLGFETYEWTADADQLAEHPSFPDDPADIDVADRPSVGGVLEFGDPEAGKTLVLNGHVDVVPVERDLWSSDPFEPTWIEDGENLRARGAADMKSGLTACVFAALALRKEHDEHESLDGRVVVESVVGEEEGGIGAAAAALDNPYPFERDAALVAEPTNLRVVTATEGSVMKRLHLTGRSAHAATRWVGESVLPHFETVRHAFEELEQERGESVSHPLYNEFPIPWPVVFGTVQAGSWASTVPAELTAEVRIGVAPGETVDEVETQFEERLAEVVADSEWLSARPPKFERFSVQFEAGETAPDESVVAALRGGMREAGLDDTDPRGATYGADSRHYVAAGIPTVLFGPGTIEQAHYPDETVRWSDVERARETITASARRYLSAK